MRTPIESLPSSDVDAAPATSEHGESPIRMSPILGRPIRQDGLDTLGISTQTLAEDALEAGRWELAAELAAYFVTEIRIMNDVLFTWIADILDFRLSRETTLQPRDGSDRAGRVPGLRTGPRRPRSGTGWPSPTSGPTTRPRPWS